MVVDFVAGMIAGGASVLCGHPLDTIKVRLQAQTSGQYRGMFDVLGSIIRKESPMALYKGITSPLAGLALVNAIVFGVYGNMVKQFSNPKSEFAHCSAGAVAGFAQSFIASPMELAKLRCQLQSQGQPYVLHIFFLWKGACTDKYLNPFDCARQVLRTEGIRGLYRGWGATIARDCSGFGIYFALYEWLTKKMSPKGPEHMTSLQLLMAGGVAGMSSWLSNYPIDVIKTRLQAEPEVGKSRYSGFWDCTRKTWTQLGAKGFTEGLGVTLARAFFMNAVTFFVLEWVYRIHEGRLNPLLQRLMKDGHDSSEKLFVLPEAGGTLLDPADL